MKENTNCVFCGLQKTASGYRYKDGVKWVCSDCEKLWIEEHLLNSYKFDRIRKVMDKIENWIVDILDNPPHYYTNDNK